VWSISSGISFLNDRCADGEGLADLGEQELGRDDQWPA